MAARRRTTRLPLVRVTTPLYVLYALHADDPVSVTDSVTEYPLWTARQLYGARTCQLSPTAPASRQRPVRFVRRPRAAPASADKTACSRHLAPGRPRSARLRAGCGLLPGRHPELFRKPGWPLAVPWARPRSSPPATLQARWAAAAPCGRLHGVETYRPTERYLNGRDVVELAAGNATCPRRRPV